MTMTPQSLSPNLSDRASSAGLASPPPRSASRIDAGILAIRIGIALSFILLLALKQAEAAKFFASATGTHAPNQLWPVILLSITALSVVLGFQTRLAATLAALACLYSAFAALHLGLDWFVFPVRSAEYAFLFTTLAITGPGKFSFDHLRHSPAS
jgi:uncharacterized membrane protein YphA (DoxX/SURF4 family)